MKRIQIHDFVKSELDTFRAECNFTDEELEFFNLRAKNITLEAIAEQMTISVGKADKLSRKVKSKVMRVIAIQNK